MSRRLLLGLGGVMRSSSSREEGGEGEVLPWRTRGWRRRQVQNFSSLTSHGILACMDEVTEILTRAEHLIPISREQHVSTKQIQCRFTHFGFRPAMPIHANLTSHVSLKLRLLSFSKILVKLSSSARSRITACLVTGNVSYMSKTPSTHICTN